MKKYRFIPKTYGRGFVPISREGWIFTFFLVSVVLGSAYTSGIIIEGQESFHGIVRFIVDLYIIIFSSLWFMNSKTDGELKRRRGKKTD